MSAREKEIETNIHNIISVICGFCVSIAIAFIAHNNNNRDCYMVMRRFVTCRGILTSHYNLCQAGDDQLYDRVIDDDCTCVFRAG